MGCILFQYYPLYFIEFIDSFQTAQKTPCVRKVSKIPTRLLTEKNLSYRVIPIEPSANSAFIDFKIYGFLHQLRAAAVVGGGIYMACMEGGQPIFCRPGLGFYHPNFTMLFGEECTTVRSTLGLDPVQINLLADYFETIETLNGPKDKSP